MQVLDDEISQTELFDSVYTSPKHCFYCKIESPFLLARCEICSKWFCSVNIPGGLHLYCHMTNREHKIWTLHPNNTNNFSQLKCSNCFNDDLSKLCIYNEARILCRSCCRNEDNVHHSARFDEVVINGQLSKLIFNNPNEQEKQIALSITYSQASIIENNILAEFYPNFYQNIKERTIWGLKKVKLLYNNANEFYEIFSEILLKDKYFQEKKTNDKEIIKSRIHLNSGSPFFDFNQLQSVLRFKTGELVQIMQKHQPVCRAVICSNNVEEKTVSIKILSKSTVINDHGKYEIKHLFSSVPYERMMNGLKYLKKNQMDKDILSTILGVLSIKRNICGINYINNNQDSQFTPPNLIALNESQLNAVKQALKVNISIIQGPPGTGKTHTTASIVWNIKQILSKLGHNYSKILASSSSNIAVDNLVERIHKTGLKVAKVASKLREKIRNTSEIVEENSLHTFLRQHIEIYHPNIFDLFSCIHEYDEIVEREQYQELLAIVNPAITGILNEADVIVCTNIVAGDKRLDNLYFQYVLIDEANQSIEPESLLPILRGCQNLILLGDEMQLGPITSCFKTKQAGLNTTLISRLKKLGLKPILLNT